MLNAKAFQRSLLAIAISPIISLPAHAATITSSATCSLIEAIESANTDALVGNCVAADVTGTFGDDTVIVTSQASELASVDVSGNALGIVTSNLTIQGDGNTLSIADGTVAQQFIDIQGSEADVTIENLTLDGSGAASNIGAISLTDSARLEIENSTVSNNTAGRPGAGIYLSNGYLTLIDTDFIDNTVGTGSGGAIRTYGSSVSISGGIMSNNTAGLGGAIFSSDSVITIDGTSFSQNSASNLGGAIFAVDSNVVVLNSSLSQNSGSNGGGAIYVLSRDTSSTSTHALTLENSTLTTNTSFNFGSEGVGIRAIGIDVAMTGGAITASRGREGGGIHFDGENLRSLTIDGTSVSSNTATFDGGGIFIKDAVNVQIDNAVIESNISGSNYSGAGGGLHLTNSTVTINSSRVDSNTTSEEGGGIFLNSSVNLTVSNSSISSNSSTRDGGGIYASYDLGGSTEINLNTVGLINNVSQQSGGGLYAVYSSGVNIQNSTIANNTAGNAGGGMEVLGAQLSIISSTISNNTSPFKAGVSIIGVNYGSTIYNSTIVENQSSSAGGLYSSLGLTMENTIVANNGFADCDIGSGVLSGTNNWFGDDSCNGVAQGDPDLGALPDFVQCTIANDLVHTPNSSSGLIGAANSLFCNGVQFGFDQLGSTRKAQCDIGAIETEESGSTFVIPLANGKSVIFEL